MRRQTFALYFGNRGFFPESLIASARTTLRNRIEALGFDTLLLEEDATRFGAVETVAEGETYAAFLRRNEGRYDGVVLSLPNFGDETGAIAALRDCGTPILVHAWPDEIGRMDFEHRRDAFCGKFSVLDVFHQYGLPCTTLPPHTVHPDDPAFAGQMERFASVCRIVKGMRRLTVGAVGARTTAFKTVRFDELALQRHGITTETLDLSELFQRVRDITEAGERYALRRERLLGYTNWPGVPAEKVAMLTRLSLALDDVITEYGLDCLALRCWNEIETELRVSPCVLLSELNDRGVTAACELDVCNAVPMRALALASGQPATCLDWNNNYGGDPDKCILFHCGPVPQSLMAGKGRVTDHRMFAKSYGAGCGWGCNEGRIGAFPMTFASAKTENGRLSFYLGEGAFTEDPIEEGFFGCGGVARIGNLQQKLLAIGRKGYRHHVGVTRGLEAEALREAFTDYLGYDLETI